MIKYAWRKCMTDTIFLLRSGCFSMRIVWAVRTQGLSSRCFLKETYIPSLCSGGTPETSHSSTRLFVSLSKHMAKFRIPTSILRIIILKDLYIFKLKSATKTIGTSLTKVSRGGLTSWGETNDHEKNDKEAAAHNGGDDTILHWTSETFEESTNKIGETFVFGTGTTTSRSIQIVHYGTCGNGILNGSRNYLGRNLGCDVLTKIKV